MNKKKSIGVHLIAMCTVIICMLCFTACGGQNQKESDDVAVDLKALQESMLAEDTTLPEMTKVSNEDSDAELNFSYLSELDYNLVDSYYYAYASDGTAPEIAVVKVKDSQDVVTMMDSLKEHIESRKGTFQEYSPEQVTLVDKAVLIHQGNYIALIICEKSGLVQQAFKDAFGQ